MSYPMDSLIHGGGLRYKNGVAGEVVTAYQVVYGAGDGRWYLADADVGTSVSLMGLTVDPAIITQRSRILIKGIVQNVAWTWTPGQPLYLSQVAGGMTQTAPALPARTQVVGFAINGTQIYFNPQLGGDLLSLMDYEVQVGIIAEPTVPSKGNGHTVVVHNETEERDFVWVRTDLDTKWAGCEYL